MNTRYLYPGLLILLTLASFFHIQGIVVGIVLFIIAMPLKHQVRAIVRIRLFALLLIPAFIGLVVGYRNDNYLILKDLYYFSLPVLFILSGIVLACRMEVPMFLKTLVWAGAIASVMVTVISVTFVGLSSLFDPYSAHYAIGIVGTPAPPVALACLLLSHKFNVKLFSGLTFKILVALNTFGIYMFASRTYLVITCCFMVLLLADKIKRLWIIPVLFVVVVLFSVVPADLFKTGSNNGTFVNKIIGSFSEMSIGNYRTEQDINIRYRGYESFMAIQTYAKGSTAEWIFGGLGKLVDLKTFIRLGQDTEFQFIPVLHNGWLYILVKTGLFGVVTYISIFLTLVVINWRKYASSKVKPMIRLFAAFTVGSILSLLFTNYVVSAFFNVEMSILMITMGYSYLNYHSLLYTLNERERNIPINLNGLKAA